MIHLGSRYPVYISHSHCAPWGPATSAWSFRSAARGPVFGVQMDSLRYQNFDDQDAGESWRETLDVAVDF